MKTRTKLLFGGVGVLALGAVGFAAVADAHGMRGGWGGHRMGGMAGMGMTQLFERADANGDGSVTRDEAAAFVGGRLSANDGNGDGNLTLDEFQPLYLELTRPMMVRGFQFLDADGDGNVTEAEMNRPVERLFDRADRNDDGAIAEDELGRGGRGERSRDD